MGATEVEKWSPEEIEQALELLYKDLPDVLPDGVLGLGNTPEARAQELKSKAEWLTEMGQWLRGEAARYAGHGARLAQAAKAWDQHIENNLKELKDLPTA